MVERKEAAKKKEEVKERGSWTIGWMTANCSTAHRGGQLERWWRRAGKRDHGENENNETANMKGGEEEKKMVSDGETGRRTTDGVNQQDFKSLK